MLGSGRSAERISAVAGFEEAMFLGLRMNEGISVGELRREFGGELVAVAMAEVRELVEAGLLEMDGDRLRLTGDGRMVSNEVFGRLLVETTAAA